MGNTVATKSIQVLKYRTQTSLRTAKEKATTYLSNTNENTELGFLAKQMGFQRKTEAKFPSSLAIIPSKTKDQFQIEMSETEEREKANEKENKLWRAKLFSLIFWQLTFLFYKIYEGVACVEDKKIVLRGPEKDVKSILRYLEPFESQYSFKVVKHGVDADKSLSILNLTIIGPSYKTLTSGDTTSQRYSLLFQLFSKLCQRNNLSFIADALKLQKERTTLLICIPPNISFTPENVKWICPAAETNAYYDDFRLVVTECSCKINCRCSCKCKSFSIHDIPNEIKCKTTGPPIFQRSNWRRIGTPLFLLKYNGNFDYDKALTYMMFTVFNLIQGFGNKGLKELFKRKNQISKWRCFNCDELPPIKNAIIKK